MNKEKWYKEMLELKKAESHLFEHKWIHYRNFLLNIHFTLEDGNPLKKEIEDFTKHDIDWKS